MRKRNKTEDWRKQRREYGGSIRERNGKIYARIQYFGEDGKRHDKEREASNRKHARELIKEMRAELGNHGETALDSHRMTFRDLASIYEKQKLVPAVIVDGRKVAGLRSYRSARRFLVPLVAHFGRKQIRTITHSDLEEFKLIRFQTPVTIGKNGADSSDQNGTRKRSKRKRPIKPRKPSSRQRSITAVNRELEMLRTIFSFAEQSDWVAKSPFKKGASLISKASERQRDRVLTLDEEARLLAACSGRRAHLRPLIVTALDTGMRRGELLKLVWPDVDFALDLIRVRATNTKTERPRSIGMTPRVREALLALREVAPPNYEGVVFGIKDTVKNGFLSALHEAGIEDFRFHDCRHTAITRMIQAGIPATETMKISGHTQFVTFARYVNVNEQAARKGAERLAEYISQSGANESQELVH